MSLHACGIQTTEDDKTWMGDQKQKYDLEWPYDMKELLLHVHMLIYTILVHYLTHYMLVAWILKKQILVLKLSSRFVSLESNNTQTIHKGGELEMHIPCICYFYVLKLLLIRDSKQWKLSSMCVLMELQQGIRIA